MMNSTNVEDRVDDQQQTDSQTQTTTQNLILDWRQAVEFLSPHVVRISTPEGSGTGFLVSYAKSQNICGIATAAHVVSHSYKWEQPIRIEHFQSEQSVILHHDERGIFIDESKDTAAIAFSKGNIPFPETAINLIPEGYYVPVGTEIGWVGFPAISPSNLCLFTGRISCCLQGINTYLVDGVSINGVSGGPTFLINESELIVIGVVSAYAPNRATGESLPGLSVIRDVSQFPDFIRHFRSIDEAKGEEKPLPGALDAEFQAEIANEGTA